MEELNNVFVDPETPDVDYAELGFDDQLKYTQRIKGRVLHKLVSGPGGIPEDKDGVELILKVADSMDKTTIAKKRLAVDEKQGDHAQSVLNAVLLSIGRDNPFLRSPDSEPQGNQDIGELPDFGAEHAQGEAEVGVIVDTSDKFLTRMDIVNKEELERRSSELGLNI